MGRPPIGQRPMTGAERLRRHRERLRASKAETKLETKPETKPQPGLCAACALELVNKFLQAEKRFDIALQAFNEVQQDLAQARERIAELEKELAAALRRRSRR
jgi:hypothetical protein